MTIRRLAIGRVVLDGVDLSAERAEAFRTELAQELARLLSDTPGEARPISRALARVDVAVPDGGGVERVTADLIAQSVARSILGT
jgi:hypothetical protein